MNCNLSPYTLPTLNFIAGESQEINFRVYNEETKQPFSLTTCTCDFAIVDYMNKTGAPIITKQMDVELNDENNIYHIAHVDLLALDTLNLDGKYAYQIQIRNNSNNSNAIPYHGVIYITNNIHKAFITNAS